MSILEHNGHNGTDLVNQSLEALTFEVIWPEYLHWHTHPTYLRRVVVQANKQNQRHV